MTEREEIVASSDDAAEPAGDEDPANEAEGVKAAEEAAGGADPLMPCIIDAVRARATLGEISNALRSVWGTYQA